MMWHTDTIINTLYISVFMLSKSYHCTMILLSTFTHLKIGNAYAIKIRNPF